MQIFRNNIEILLFLSVTCQLEKEIRKIDRKNDETGSYFRTDVRLPRIFSTLKVLPLLHTCIVYHIDCICEPTEISTRNTNSQEVSTPISLAREPTGLIYFLTAEATAGLANWLLFTVQRNETEKEEIKSSIYSLQFHDSSSPIYFLQLHVHVYSVKIFTEIHCGVERMSTERR